MASKKPSGVELLELCDKWKSSNHEGKLELCKQYDVPYGTMKGWILQGPNVELELQPTELTQLESAVHQIVSKGSVSVGEISRQVDRSRETIIKTIDSLREKHFVVLLDEVSHEVHIPEEPSKVFVPTEYKYFRNFYRIGLVADTHIGSKFQQLTLLHDAYSVFDDRKVDFILHAGDLVEGVGLYRGQDIELFLHDASEQRDYTVRNYPIPKGRAKTYVIGGQHDRSFYRDRGYDIVEHICEKRPDLIYKGFFKAEFKIRGIPIVLMHPGGGTSYARSYRVQKIIESMVGALSNIQDIPIPRMVVFGHWHIPIHLPDYMGVDAISLPCFQRQTPYLEQKGLMPAVGFAVMEVWLDKSNHVTSTKVEFLNWNHRIVAKDY